MTGTDAKTVAAHVLTSRAFFRGTGIWIFCIVFIGVSTEPSEAGLKLKLSIMFWKTRRHKIDLLSEENSKGMLMGILNTTPDSFSDGGQHFNLSDAVAVALQMVARGANIIDIGGESTRPGAPAVSADEEIQRTVPVLRALRERSDVMISIDSSKASVAAAALEAGADIVNDVTGLNGDPEMANVCAEAQCGVVVMHMQGTPRTMQIEPQYKMGVVHETMEFFKERLASLKEAGIDPESICIDPGIGFGKTVEQNVALIKNLADIQKQVGRPVLLGVSRKSIIGALTGIEDPQQRDAATAMLTCLNFREGILLHRVHDIEINRGALGLAHSIYS